MNYLNPGDSISAAHWNDLIQQADAQLTTMLGGLSAVFAGVDQQFDRAFFFGFDPINLPATLHERAAVFIPNWTTKVYQTSPFYLRQYSHSAITGVLSGLSQLANSSKFQAVKLSRPTWATWSAAIYPSGFGAISDAPVKQTISGTVYPLDNCLDVSLQVHKSAVSGTPYAITFGGFSGDVTTAEHAWPLKPIDVFTLGDLGWDGSWDKYSIVRVHNAGRTACAATFGSASATIKAGASKCFRKLATGWIVCGNYFHSMQPGDGRFMQMLEAGVATPPGPGSVAHGSAPSCFMPGVVTDVLRAVVAQTSFVNTSKQPDLTKFFDLSPIYNNAGYVKSQAIENDPPAGGYFPTPTAATPLGDLIIPRGKYLIANRSLTVVHATMTVTVAQTAFFDGTTWIAPLLIAGFVDGSNVVANVSNIAVTNQTTGQTINAYSDPSDPTGPNLGATANWRQLGDGGLAIFARGSYYDGASWQPVTPPPSGLYAPFISQGDVLKITFDYIAADDHVFVNFDGFATLAAKLAAAGVTTRALVEGSLNNLEIYTAGGWHMIDLSCPLVTFLTNGSFPARTLGASQAASPPSLKLPWLKFTGLKVTASNTASNFTYDNWAFDSSGKLVSSSTTTVTTHQAGSSFSLPTTTYLPTDTGGDVFNWMAGQAAAGGVTRIENLRFLSTTFGHVLLFDEIWPLDSKFDAAHFNSVYGTLPALSVVYDQLVGLRVTRLVLLEATNYVATNNGIFPPIGNASSYLFWHFARVDRHFAFPRWFQTLSADSPWFATANYWNAKLAPTQYQDDLTRNETNYVAAFYEPNPIDVDKVTIARPHRKFGISRMGKFSLAGDIWSAFSYWLKKIPTLIYPNGASPSNVNTSSGWYFLNSTAVIANSAISQPLQNIPPCQVEHYNSVASLVNGTQPFRYKVNPANSLWSGWNYTLDFTLANVVLIDGGLGYVVGDVLNFNLKVATVDANGTITALAQNGSPYIGTFTAQNTISRPFGLGNSLTGNGALCDTTVGNGSTLAFIPPYSTVSIPVAPTPPTGTQQADFAARLTDSYTPRQAWFAWYGATAGCADPVADYLASLGVTIQTGVPDSYGDPLPTFAYDLRPTGSVTSSRLLGYQYGCDLNWQKRVGAYRWISIDDARSLYANLSLPFVLSELVVPFKWRVFNIDTPVPTSTTVSNQTRVAGVDDSPPSHWPPANNGAQGPHYISPEAAATLPPAGGGYLGPVNVIQADFFNDPDGQWVRPYRNENICNTTSPLAGPIRSWWEAYTFSSSFLAGHDYSYDFSLVEYQFGNYNPWDYYSGSDTTASMQGDLAIPAEFMPAGFVMAARPSLPPFKQIMWFPNKMTYDLTAVVARYEGVPGKLVCCIPQNVAYYDEPWVAATLHSLYPDGTQIADVLPGVGNPKYCPIIADDTVELNGTEAAFVSGTGTGGPETLITSNLTNARLLVVSVDSQIQQQFNPPPDGGI